ncbi:hypothetical protein DFJ58DRAFT_726194 [Suillus subalutaceus]|uniref:uncharacterized protein n=1 Tax=Suillus subalutaceus TaxID=48586 RepID=UPI001B867B4E|nr:uncharacterized protein DFJ58DRAFT_726194 [Suillus subalutaceus]KAG1860182.1 hypothetical protein DFJ58DRAFT_726194 [Suillus subalutaceus]
MSSSIVENISQDADSSAASPPRGWSATITNPKIVEEMLKYSTGLDATLELSEDRGSRNTSIASRGKALGALKLEELPDYGGDLEG